MIIKLKLEPSIFILIVKANYCNEPTGKSAGKEDTCEIIRAKIAECERVIVLETKRRDNM